MSYIWVWARFHLQNISFKSANNNKVCFYNIVGQVIAFFLYYHENLLVIYLFFYPQNQY